MTDEEPPRKRSWFKRSEPMDEASSRTMFVGLIIAFALYGLSFVLTAVYDDPWSEWASIGLILVSVLFLGGWFLAVRGGFRIGKTKSRAKRRAEMHAKAEKEKRMRLNR